MLKQNKRLNWSCWFCGAGRVSLWVISVKTTQDFDQSFSCYCADKLKGEDLRLSPR